MKKYSSYKDSGVEWLGEIPSHWEVKRLASYFLERKIKVSDKDYEPLSVTMQGILPQLDTAAKTNDGDNRKLVINGDFVINSRSDRKGSSGVSPYDGSVSLINIVLTPRKSLYTPFCNYLLKSKAFIDEFYRNGRGIVADLWTTRYQEMKLIKLAVPSIDEQKAITKYLDSKVKHIDQAIAQQQKMIDLLNERKQIIIQKAVTKGLDPNAEMKDSGIEWIGEIPKNWNLYPLKRTVLLITAKRSTSDSNFNVSLENIESWSGKYVKTDSKYEGEGVAFTKDDILFGKLRPYLAKVLLADKDGIALGDFYVLRPTKFLPSYLKYVMLSKGLIYYIDSSTYGTKMPRANWSFIGSCSVPIPSKKQQYDIASYLDERLANIDNLVLKAQEIISLLQERKQIIINNVVTGKVKVC